MRVGVVIPTLQEFAEIGTCIAALRALVGDWVIAVADGGSDDGTRAAAREAGADLVLNLRPTDADAVSSAPSAEGRGPQLAAGAAALLEDSSVQALLLLHVDCRLPADAARWIGRTLADPRWSAGAFHLRHQCSSGAGPIARRLVRLADMRSRRSAYPYGDQAVFLSRGAYRAVGGVPLQPLMEDLELSRRLHRRGPIRRIPAEVQASARRFEGKPIRTTLKWWTFPLLYRLGVSPQRLARWYR